MRLSIGTTTCTNIRVSARLVVASITTASTDNRSKHHEKPSNGQNWRGLHRLSFSFCISQGEENVFVSIFLCKAFLRFAHFCGRTPPLLHAPKRFSSRFRNSLCSFYSTRTVLCRFERNGYRGYFFNALILIQLPGQSSITTKRFWSPPLIS